MTIRETTLRAVTGGAAASLLSAAALAVCGKLEGKRAAGPINGPSQWLWGRRAAHAQRASARHTLVGYAIHHLASTGWALLFERWRRRGGTPTVARDVGAAAATAAAACFVDYKLTPKRLQPGFEVQLSKPSMAAVYGMFALGLALAATVTRRRR